jgi:hypothetical protein
MAITAVPPRRKFAQVIEPEETAEQFTPVDKMVFSFMEVARPVTLLPALYSASVRVLSDGILASAFHQDPRYYRIGEGSVIHRGPRCGGCTHGYLLS